MQSSTVINSLCTSTSVQDGAGALQRFRPGKLTAEEFLLVQSNVVFLVVSQLHSPKSGLFSSFTRVVAGEIWRLCRAGTVGQKCRMTEEFIVWKNK